MSVRVIGLDASTCTGWAIVTVGKRTIEIRLGVVEAQATTLSRNNCEGSRS